MVPPSANLQGASDYANLHTQGVPISESEQARGCNSSWYFLASEIGERAVVCFVVSVKWFEST